MYVASHSRAYKRCRHLDCSLATKGLAYYSCSKTLALFSLVVSLNDYSTVTRLHEAEDAPASAAFGPVKFGAAIKNVFPHINSIILQAIACSSFRNLATALQLQSSGCGINDQC